MQARGSFPLSKDLLFRRALSSMRMIAGFTPAVEFCRTSRLDDAPGSHEVFEQTRDAPMISHTSQLGDLRRFFLPVVGGSIAGLSDSFSAANSKSCAVSYACRARPQHDAL